MSESGEVKPITGQVARVVSNTRLVINRGAEHGVKLGQTFSVMSAKGEPITDPESGEVIGQLPLEKVRVRVTEVYERMAVAETYRVTTIGGSSPLASVFGPPRDVLETFQSDDQSLISSDSTVRVKDPVRQLISAKRDSF